MDANVPLVCARAGSSLTKTDRSLPQHHDRLQYPPAAAHLCAQQGGARVPVAPLPHIAPSPTATDPHPSSRAAQDVLQNLQYFFGAPVSPEKLKDYSEHHAMTYHFPDAYAGQNVRRRARTARPQAHCSRLFLAARRPRSGTPSTTSSCERRTRITNVAVPLPHLPLLTPFPCHVQEVAPELADVGRPALLSD